MLSSLAFDSPLLTSTVAAIERRGRAIRYSNVLKCSRLTRKGGLERLNVNLRSFDRLQLRFSLWPDSVFWLSVTKPRPLRKGGWQINKQVEGTIALWTPSEIVERLEATMITPTDISRIWQPRAKAAVERITAPPI